jgi:AcrR family transcriptional regulator
MASEPTPTPNAATRWRGRPRDTRSHQAILAAALDLLNEVGYQRLTMEGVAKRAGVGKSTIYRWWQSKLYLLLEAAAPHLEIGLVPDTGSTRGDLTAGVGQAIDTYSDRVAAHVIFAVITDLEEDPRLGEIFRETWVLPWRASMADAIERGVSRGDLPKGLDIQFLIDVLVGTIFQRVLIVRQPMTKSLVKRLVDLVMEGKLL